MVIENKQSAENSTGLILAIILAISLVVILGLADYSSSAAKQRRLDGERDPVTRKRKWSE